MTTTRASLSDVLGIPVTKSFLVDLTTGEAKDFLFNPAELTEVFGVNWNMFTSPGLSHKRPQFVDCDNMEWSMTALFDQLYYEQGKVGAPPTNGPNTSTINLATGGLPSEVEDWRNFLLSLATPRRVPAGGKNRIAAASPTPVHFEWPGLVSTTVRIKGGTLKHTMFAQGTARVRIYSVDLKVFEDPAERMYADEVRKNGTIRSWASSSPSGRGR